MARPVKSGLDYFPMDVDFYSDRKIKVLLAHYGADGVALYIYLLIEIYRNSYYIEIDDDFYYVASIDLGISPDNIKEIINYLCSHFLFDNTLFSEMNILTSRGVQLRYQEAVKTRASKRKVVVEDELWLLKSTETQRFIKMRSEKDNENSNYENEISKNENYDYEDDDFYCDNPETGFSEINSNNSLNNYTKESKVNKNKINKNKGQKIERESTVVLQLPSKDGIYCVTDNDYNEMTEKYLNIDVLQCLRKMCDFLQHNPDKQRKLCAMQNYIEMWLERDNSQNPKTHNLTLSSDTSYDITTFDKYDLFD